MRFRSLGTVLAAVVPGAALLGVMAGPAHAQSAPTPDPLALAPALAATTDFSGFAELAPTVAAVNYQRRGTPYASGYTSPVQIHGGAFGPRGRAEEYQAVFGIRGGPQLADRLQLGVMVDWMHRTLNGYTPVSSPYSAAGQTIAPTRLASSAKTDLLPVMAFMQVGTMGPILAPYAGIAGGYEWLFLAAKDYESDATYYANFSGWGWQAWAGLGLPLGDSVRLNAEVYHNGSVVDRPMTDANGVAYTERVDVSGVGARAGIFFGY